MGIPYLPGCPFTEKYNIPNDRRKMGKSFKTADLPYIFLIRPDGYISSMNGKWNHQKNIPFFTL